MRGIFINEIMKMRNSKAVKIVFWIFCGYGVFCAMVPGTNETSLMRRGYFAPFMMIVNYGIMFFIYAAIAGGMVDDEFEYGTVHNLLGCGIGRGRYFVAKAVCILGISAVIYVVSTACHTAARYFFFGGGSGRADIPDYVLKALVYNLGALSLVLAYQCLFICFSMLFRNAAMTFLTAVVVTWIDSSIGGWRVKLGKNWLGGPCLTSLRMREMAVKDCVLSAEFCALLVPSICVGVLSLLAAYQVFKRKDIK